MPQTLGSTQMHKCHTRLEKVVPRERYNKCYTREKGSSSGVGGGPKERDQGLDTQP